MKAATVSEIKKELKHRSPDELLEICLRLSKFKKENKELLTYLLYEVDNEEAYIQSVKNEIDQQFSEINKSSFYFIKKSVRKILRNIKKHCRYSGKKETEVELLIYFCNVLKNMSPSIKRDQTLYNIYLRQIEIIKKIISTLHEDLQYDYNLELENF
ncbi:hypothetical protein FRY74_02825 [Vicingus serpentipes]|uniref:Uncharacterized protein n=1 Tax=Vicingus serpentipes TaxID=1926625 RepID=A0A5C6RXR2_9FLAO|nr:hypothetical protein [Vicingus serpentipes]TXB67376.1 hypothetical protein FRY74_02825 [Vicingus serpentipes]